LELYLQTELRTDCCCETLITKGALRRLFPQEVLLM